MKIRLLTKGEIESSLYNLAKGDKKELVNLSIATNTPSVEYFNIVKRSMVQDRDVFGITYHDNIICFGNVLLNGIIWMLTTKEVYSLNKEERIHLFIKLREHLRDCFEECTNECFYNIIHKDNHEHIKFVKALGGKFEKAPDDFEGFLMFRIYRSDYV